MCRLPQGSVIGSVGAAVNIILDGAMNAESTHRGLVQWRGKAQIGEVLRAPCREKTMEPGGQTEEVGTSCPKA